MLKDYPDHIEQLQEDLNHYIQNPSRLTPFDGAIWILEAALENFITKARQELKAAEASGNAVTIEKARNTELLMLHARGLHGLHDLHAYFQANKEMFE
jgi:hypothetical protein